MTDNEIIKEMEKILQVPLVKLKPDDIEKKRIYSSDIKRGYSKDGTGMVTGLRLESLFIRPALEYIGRLHRVSRLNLNSSQLKPKDIPFLRQNKNITFLNISYNADLQDFSFLKELQELTSVDLNRNNLSDVSFLRGLKGLTSVDLNRNNLSDVSFLRELRGLTSVDLSWNNLTDVSFLRELRGLTSVNLGYNHLTDVSFLRELQGLTSVDLSWNNLTDVSFLRELRGLTSVDLSGNPQLTDVSFLRELRGLTSVGLSRNNLTDVSFLRELQGLTSVDLSWNSLTDVSFLRELQGLTSVALNRNNLTDVSFLADLDHLFDFDIKGNPTKNLPPEIVRQGVDAMKNYFQSLKKGAEKKLNEVKILIVGDGGAGKTSLANRLLTNSFNIHEPQTDGINITLLPVRKENLEITTRLWDFGGQEIMHATHQFFLSKRSLYIVVIDGRKDEDPEYWLKHIEIFGGFSPIIVVINKIDQNPSFEVNRKFLQDKYPNIKAFCRLSCNTGEGIDSFKKSLEDHLFLIELHQSFWPLSWFNVKTTLENMTNHFISYQEYLQICSEQNITDSSSQDTLLEYLNDLGVILNFKTLELRDTHILQPKWATSAVYKIINSPILAASNGVLNIDLLGQILNKETTAPYHCPLDKHGYIINLMKKFRLCYSLDENHLLIPDLLQVEEKVFDFDYDVALKFVFKYDFLPNSIMPRFIVNRQRDIHQNLQWRTGVVLQEPYYHTTALIKADRRDQKITVWVTGERKREYFTIIRNTICEINDSFQKLTVSELVPLPDYPNELVDYQELIGYEEMGKSDYTSGKLRKEFAIKQLLDGIESEAERMQPFSLDNIGHNIYNSTVYMNTKKEVNKMSNQNILFGDNATIHGDFTVAGIIRDSFNKIGASAVSPDLKNMLQDLTEAVNQMVEKMEKDEAETVVKDLQTFTTEALSKKPRQEWWQLSAKGLKEAAKTAGQLGISIVTNLDKVILLLNTFV